MYFLLLFFKKNQKFFFSVFIEMEKMGPQVHMEFHGALISQNNLEKEQRQRTHFQISKLTTKLQQSKQHGTGIRVDT